jgi:hypothetical protein
MKVEAKRTPNLDFFRGIYLALKLTGANQSPLTLHFGGGPENFYSFFRLYSKIEYPNPGKKSVVRKILTRTSNMDSAGLYLVDIQKTFWQNTATHLQTLEVSLENWGFGLRPPLGLQGRAKRARGIDFPGEVFNSGGIDALNNGGFI